MSAVRKSRHVVSRLSRRFTGDEKGVAGIEMGIITPVLLLLLCGGGEFFVYGRAHFQAAQMASTVADAISRYESVTSADIASIFSVSSNVMGTDDFKQNGYVILSSVSRASGSAPTVKWQCKGGGLPTASRIGEVTKTATVPGGLALDATDDVIIAEVYYQHQPLFKSFVPNFEKQIYKTAVFRPRLGSLTTAPGC